MKKYLIAIDLHGTLLDNHWKLSDNDVIELIELIKKLSKHAVFYICTGNDLSFVEKYVPKDLLDNFDGCVLESGAIINRFSHNSHLTDSNIINYINELKCYFLQKNYAFVKSFANRETTISMFTTDENGGEAPVRFYDVVNNDLKAHKFRDMFYVTWSNVALDIIPNNISKWTAIKQLADDMKIISFLDSFNDKEIALNSHYVILPINSADSLIQLLRNDSKLVFSLNKFHFKAKHCYISQYAYTKAVIDGLKYLESILL